MEAYTLYWVLYILGLSLVAFTLENIFRSSIRVLSRRKEYDDFLNKLPKEKFQSIRWITKTSVWADQNSDRLKNKKAGLSSSRIKSMKYIVNLSYWRNAVQENSNKKYDILREYENKLLNLRDNLENIDYSSADVLIIPAPDSLMDRVKMGLYNSAEGYKTVVIGFEGYDMNSAPTAVAIQGCDDLYYAYLEYFDMQWRQVKNLYLAGSRPEKNDMANNLSKVIEKELNWVKSKLPHDIDDLLTDDTELRRGIEIFKKENTVSLSCPQKVCFAGDYNDLVDEVGLIGKTLTAAIDAKARLRLTATQSGTVKCLVDGRKIITENLQSEWPIIGSFVNKLSSSEVINRYEGLELEMQPSRHMEVGLGSSGAASVLLTAAYQILRGEPLNNAELIEAAHHFEDQEAERRCGPQDHAASVLGKLRVLEYEVEKLIGQEEVGYGDVERYLSYWDTTQKRRAFDFIVPVLDELQKPLWLSKTSDVETMRMSFKSGDFKVLKLSFRREADMQSEIGMLTSDVSRIINEIQALDCGAKLSGAGGGGTLVVVTDRQSHESNHHEVRELLQNNGYKEITINISDQGLKFSK